MLIVPSILTFEITTSNSEGNTAIRPVLAEEPFETNSRFGCPSDTWATVITELLNQVEPVITPCGSSKKEQVQAAHKLKHRITYRLRDVLGFDVYGYVEPSDEHDTHELVFAFEDTEESKQLGHLTLIPRRVLPRKIKRVLTEETLRDYYHVGDTLVSDKACWCISRLEEHVMPLPCHLEDGSLGLEYSFVASMSLNFLGEASMRQIDDLEEAANEARYPNRRMVRGLDPLREFVVPKDAKISVSDSVFDSLGRLNVELKEVSNGE